MSTKSDHLFRVAARRFAPFEKAIRKQWEQFELEHRTGLTLSLEAMELPALEEIVLAPRTRRTGDWDLAFINTDWIAAASSDGCVRDLAPFLENNPPPNYPEGWADSMLRLQNIDGFVAGLPYHDGPECLIYRRDLFNDARERSAYEQRYGASLQPPATWSEFEQIARFFHRPEKNLYGTVFAAFPDGHNTVYDFLLQLWTRGGDLFSPDGSPQFTTPAACNGLNFYRTLLAETGPAHPRCRELDSVQSGAAFIAGEVAMMANWFGFAAMCAMSSSSMKGKVDIAPMPHDEDASTVSLNVYWLLALPADCPRPELSYAFVRHCATPPMDKLLTLEGGIGCRMSTWADQEVLATVPFFDKLGQLHDTARELPQRPDWPAVAHIIDELVVGALRTCEPTEELLQRAQQQLAHLR